MATDFKICTSMIIKIKMKINVFKTVSDADDHHF